MTRPIVVCIDDNAGVLNAIVRTIQQLEIDVLSTTESHVALEWVAMRDVAVLISDYGMPEMNGIELLSAARRIRAETVRILVTGMRALETAVDGINQAEVFRYAPKPLDPVMFRAVVTGAVERHRDLVAFTTERELLTRRHRITDELEAVYPDLTRVERTEDGTYVVPPTSQAMIRGLGLDALFAASRQS